MCKFKKLFIPLASTAFIVSTANAGGPGNPIKIAGQVAKTTKAVEQGVERSFLLQKPLYKFPRDTFKPENWQVVTPSTIGASSPQYIRTPVGIIENTLAIPEEGIISSNKGRILTPSVSNLAHAYKQSPIADKPISATDRAEWKALRDSFASIEGLNSNINLANYLKHPVPQKTFDYLVKEYKSLIETVQKFRTDVFPTIVHNSLPGEGRFPAAPEVGYATTIIHDNIIKLRNLVGSLDYPLLAKYEDFFINAFEAFNPSLTGTLRHYDVIARTDREIAVDKEFFLRNPDGTDYTLPKSYSLADPEEVEEMESYAAVRESQLHPVITQEEAAIEREELLKNIPVGLRIAIINDDYLPILNFGKWGKEGYLGTDAIVDTFRDGKEFMENVRNGVHYNLVVTDLLVPHGGKAMMPELRKLDDNSIVIACSKFDREDQDAQKLLDLGFDGYLWYNSNLNDGRFGYIEYLRAMNNYFYYRDLYKWKR